jgi:DNA-binding XRE family transcriptional regulator
MLKEIRKKYHLKQHHLASLLGVGRSFIALIETHQRRMPAWMIPKLKEIFRELEGSS